MQRYGYRKSSSPTLHVKYVGKRKGACIKALCQVFEFGLLNVTRVNDCIEGSFLITEEDLDKVYEVYGTCTTVDPVEEDWLVIESPVAALGDAEY